MTEAPVRPRQLLVLGTSGTVGVGLGPAGRNWPEQVRTGLSASLGCEVELTLHRFAVHAGDPFEFLERELNRVQPDFIVQCARGRRPNEVFLDMLHKGQAWHDNVAAKVLVAFLRQ